MDLMQYTLHADLSEISTEAWDHLASKGVSDTPFARHDYVDLWWSTQGGGEWTNTQLALISATEAGELRGIAPLFSAQHEGRDPVGERRALDVRADPLPAVRRA